MPKDQKSSVTYKMVPVPADHVLDVMRYVLARDEEASARRDEERISSLLSGGDDLTRALLVRVATNALEEQPSRVRELATDLGTDDQAVIAVIRRLNKEATDAGLARVMKMQDGRFRTDDGRMWRSIVVTMAPELAALVGVLAEDADPPR
jgi:hypothetical protein